MAEQPPPGDEARLRAYYAARAAEYDRVYAKPERQDDLRRLRAWLPPWFAGRRVLEIACGTGYWTQFIAPVARAVVGLDAAAETLVLARQRPGNERVEFIVGDAYRPHADGGPFDAAFAGFWFSHVPRSRRIEFLAGLRDALGPGATVVLLDNRFVAGSSQPISASDDDGNTYQTRTLDDGTRHRVLKNFPTQAELEASIAGLGRDPVYTAFEYYWALRYVSS